MEAKARRQEEVKEEGQEMKEKEVREGDGSRGGADAARSVRRENWLLCLHKRAPSSLLPNLPFVPYLVGNRLKRNRLVLTPRRADSPFARFSSGISGAKFPRTREFAKGTTAKKTFQQ